MAATSPTTVRMFSFLHTYRRDRGLPTAVEIELPEEGMRADKIATSLDLPLERIEACFHNSNLTALETTVFPGDRVAFVPYGGPATHPAFFGRDCIRAGKSA